MSEEMKVLKLVELTAEEEAIFAAAGAAVVAVNARFEKANRGQELHIGLNFQKRLDLTAEDVVWKSDARWTVRCEDGQGFGMGESFAEALYRACIGSYPHEKLETAKKYREEADRLEREAEKGGAR